MDTLQAQMDDLRRQVKEDFQAMWLAMGKAREHLETVDRKFSQVFQRLEAFEQDRPPAA